MSVELREIAGCEEKDENRLLKKRLYSKIAVNEKTGCWEWQGCLTKSGYGSIRTPKGRTTRAHRLCYELIYGEIPKGYEVCHKCDNRRCINPDHLYLGTHQQNIQDVIRKGRQARGQKNYSSKLTERDVLEIRTRRATTTVTYEALALEYGVSSRSIKSAVNGMTWKHLKMDERGIGKTNPRRLTEEIVLAARKEREEHGTSYVDLGKKYGCSATTISQAIRGISWKKVK